MKLHEIWLNEGDRNKLADLLENHNKDLPYNLQKSFQQYAEELLKDAIYLNGKRMKSDK